MLDFDQRTQASDVASRCGYAVCRWLAGGRRRANEASSDGSRGGRFRAARLRVAALGLLLTGVVAAEESPAARKFSVAAPWAEGMSAVAVNGRGDVIGFHWEPENGDPNILYEAPFLAPAGGGAIVRLPLLKTYTATFPAGVSDDGVVVGRASKPSPPNARVYLRNQAFVWTAETGIRGLGAPEPDVASLATGISRDGRRIAGIGIGDGQLRALLWERDGDGWKPAIVPEGSGLGSNVLAISPDGKRLAAARGTRPTLWTESAPGVWKAESLDRDEDSFIPRGVNDAGVVAGFRDQPDGITRAIVWTPGRGTTTPELPPGFVHARASAINNAGVVVGQIDGPRGGHPGPRAFASEAGKLRVLDEGGPDFTWATAINDAGLVAGVMEKEEELPEAPDADANAEAAPR